LPGRLPCPLIAEEQCTPPRRLLPPCRGALTPEFRQQQSGLAMHILGVVAFVHLLNDRSSIIAVDLSDAESRVFTSFTQADLIP
jgi:FSR family fosmidomycin resistance protein-like MFS transporter